MIDRVEITRSGASTPENVAQGDDTIALSSSSSDSDAQSSVYNPNDDEPNHVARVERTDQDGDSSDPLDGETLVNWLTDSPISQPVQPVSEDLIDEESPEHREEMLQALRERFREVARDLAVVDVNDATTEGDAADVAPEVTLDVAAIMPEGDAADVAPEVRVDVAAMPEGAADDVAPEVRVDVAAMPEGVAPEVRVDVAAIPEVKVDDALFSTNMAPKPVTLVGSKHFSPSFWIKCMAHPATQVVSVVLFAAGLLALGVLASGVVSLAIGITLAAVGLFSGTSLMASGQWASRKGREPLKMEEEPQLEAMSAKMS